MRPRSGRSGLRVRIGNEGARSQVRAPGEKRRGGSPEKRKTTRRKKRKNDDDTTVTATITTTTTTTTTTNTRGADGILPRQAEALDPGEDGKAHPQPQGGAAVADQPEGETEPVHRRPVSHHSRGWGQTASYPP